MWPFTSLAISNMLTRECHVLRPDRTLRAADVLAWLERAINAHGAPTYLRSDNGPESSPKKCSDGWPKSRKAIYIDPGSPWQNGFVESFHSHFRDKCLKKGGSRHLHSSVSVVSLAEKLIAFTPSPSNSTSVSPPFQ